MKFTLDKKILSGFILCSFVLLFVAIISFQNSERFLSNNNMVNHTHEVLYELEQIMVYAVEAETGARGFVITGQEDYLAPYSNSRLNLTDHLDKAKRLTSDNAAQQKNLHTLTDLIKNHVEHLNLCITYRRQDLAKAAALISTGESRRMLNEIRTTIGNSKQIEQGLLLTRKQVADEDAGRFTLLFVALLLIIVGVLAIVYVIIRTNLRALRRAESEALGKNMTLAASSDLVKSMQGNKQLPELGRTIINHLVTHLDIQIGAIYSTEKNGMNLKLIGSHAMGKKDLTTVQFGEGTVGQAAAEKKVILLHDIKPHYFNVSTTFGQVRPRQILTVPFILEDKVVGVAELGTLGDFSARDKEYVNIVSDSIAIAIVSSQVRDEAKELLEETQRQAEEMEAQQYELRQVNEELHGKTELLEKSESELIVQQEELQQQNIELEEKANLLEEQKEKLESAKNEIELKAREIEITSKYKSEFLANMSHELRTPLNSILILAQLLSENKNDTLGEKEIEYARNIHNSGNDLLNLINEILDLSKVESGKMQLEIEEVETAQIAEGLASMFTEVARNKSIGFNIQFNSSDVPAVMATDRQRVDQILRNLLSNAFKFTPKDGAITVRVDRPLSDVAFRNKSLNTAASVISFSVSDTGIGIPKDKREIIFEAFQQADGSTKRQYGGTGLGLSISRELAQALGGEIHLSSEEGKGSTFTLYLPVKFDQATVSLSEKQVEVKKKEVHAEPSRVQVKSYDVDVMDDRSDIQENDKVILIIEDDETFAKVLLGLVRERRYKGVIASQGNTGISFARHYKPDAILLDMKLPVMDGSQVLSQIKNDPELRHIPVQIISAHDRKKETLALGAFDYMKKPVSSLDLQQAFDKIEAFKSKKLKKLLIVEDDKQQNKAIRELIGNGDVKSFSAYSGNEAQEILVSESFDCIIVDLGLPDMSGFELLEKIRANEKLNKIPIIVYTGKDLGKEDNTRLSKLADTVVLKTVNSHERLLDETILFLHRVESKLPKEKQTIIRKLHRSDEVLKDKTILLVDDDIRNIYSLTNALEEEGIRCLTAENGKTAIEMLNKNPSVDLVLMDIMMPVMDGFETTVEIRKIEAFRKLPIIALTAKAMKGDKEKCLAVGMSDYVSKPVNMTQLLSLMRVWLYTNNS